MARCDECKFWDKDIKHFPNRTLGIGECLRAKPLWDRTRWDEDDHNIRVLRPEAANDLMFCQDGSDYHAVLLTMPQFFCACFEPAS